MYRHDGFRELGEQECLRLLAKSTIGRVVFTQHALPAVLPVRYVLDRSISVVVRTSMRSPLVRALDGAVVAFEADWFDKGARLGWSVVVTGRATLVTDPGERVKLRELAVRSWLDAPEETYVAIACELVTGRALERQASGRPLLA